MNYRNLIRLYWLKHNPNLVKIIESIANHHNDNEHIIIDGSLPAPEVLPKNVVPFPK